MGRVEEVKRVYKIPGKIGREMKRSASKGGEGLSESTELLLNAGVTSKVGQYGCRGCGD